MAKNGSANDGFAKDGFAKGSAKRSAKRSASIITAIVNFIERQLQLDVTVSWHDESATTLYRLTDPFRPDRPIANIIANHRAGGCGCVSPPGTFRSPAQIYPQKTPVSNRENKTYLIRVLVHDPDSVRDSDLEAIRKVVAFAQLIVLLKNVKQKASFYLTAPAAPANLFSDTQTYVPLLGFTNPPTAELVDGMAVYLCHETCCSAAHKIDETIADLLPECCQKHNSKSISKFKATHQQIQHAAAQRAPARRRQLYQVLQRGQPIDYDAKRIDPRWNQVDRNDVQYIYSNPSDDQYLDPELSRDLNSNERVQRTRARAFHRQYDLSDAKYQQGYQYRHQFDPTRKQTGRGRPPFQPLMDEELVEDDDGGGGREDLVDDPTAYFDEYSRHAQQYGGDLSPRADSKQHPRFQRVGNRGSEYLDLRGNSLQADRFVNLIEHKMPDYMSGTGRETNRHGTESKSAEFAAAKTGDQKMLDIRRKHWDQRSDPAVQQLIYRRMYCGSQTVPDGRYLGSRAECLERGARVAARTYRNGQNGQNGFRASHAGVGASSDDEESAGQQGKPAIDAQPFGDEIIFDLF
jgi:hypothetical protein